MLLISVTPALLCVAWGAHMGLLICPAPCPDTFLVKMLQDEGWCGSGTAHLRAPVPSQGFMLEQNKHHFMGGGSFMVLPMWGPPHLPSHAGEGQAQNHTVLGGTNSSMTGGRSKLLPGP